MLETIPDRTDEVGEKEPWFERGLKFQCTGCGACCTGSPGYVFLSSSDIEHLALHLSLDLATFLSHYTTRIDDRISLIDRRSSYDCIFLTEKKCSVYEARPVQCRTFPWWIQYLQTPSDWQEAKQRCEGINHPEAPIVSSLTIQQQCLTYLDNLLEQNFQEL